MKQTGGIKLAVDLDNVCADLIGGVGDILGATPVRTNVPNLESIFPSTKFDELAVICLSPDTYLNLKPMEGAANSLHWFVEWGVYIEYVSARPISCRHASIRWLSDNGFPYPHRVTLHEHKSDYIKAQGFTAAIDDISDVLDKLFIAVPWLYLYNHPWNQGVGPYRRVNSWFDFYRAFRAEVV